MGHSSPRSQAKTTPCNNLSIFSTNRSTHSSKMAKKTAIGIDLGTTYSCVAFTDTERLIGDPAKNQVAINPTNTIFDAKRLIGRKYDDSCVQADMKHWPFNVVDESGRPKLEVEYKNENKRFTPEEVSSMVLVKMK